MKDLTYEQEDLILEKDLEKGRGKMTCEKCVHAKKTMFENRWICDIDGKIVFDEVCSEYREYYDVIKP